MKYLIVGLGNIGSEYAETRHNIGFKIVDAFAEASTSRFRTDRLGDVCEVKHKGRIYVLVKPSTFMNLSGKAVNYWLQQTKVPLNKLLVITDDISLPTGTIRIRAKGSDGGHNGLKSINEALGSSDYARMRFGVGSDFPKGRQVEYVLGQWTEEERAIIIPRIDVAVDAVRAFGTDPLGQVMTRFNG
ncbi:MAG: aminoacyl-tRNA hydrolase [Flavobacteriales bacterium]|nr:aminoacyl-tRNA hydrolase [Flavobacteriales bacterium]